MNLGYGVGVAHEIENVVLWRIGHDTGTIFNVSRPFSLAPEFAGYFYLQLVDDHVPFLSLAIQIIAITSGQCEEEQFASIHAGAETLRLRWDVERVLVAAGRQRNLMFAVFIEDSCGDVHRIYSLR